MLIPFRTDRPRLRPAYLTILLIVVNTLVQVLSQVLPKASMVVLFRGQELEIQESSVILHYGLWGSHPTPVTLFSHMFVHGDWLHLAGNMLFLWIFGSLIEDALRPWGLALLYLGGGFAAALANIGMSQLLGQNIDVPMVGASGAVAAIMGLFMLRFYRTRVEVAYWFGFLARGTFWVQSVWALLYWVVLEVFWGVLDAAVPSGGGGVAHWAHVGGFAAGALAAPFVGGIAGAKREYVTDDPEVNVEYVRRGEVVAAAERALKAEPGNGYAMRRLAKAYADAGEYARATEMYQRCLYRFGSRGMVDQALDVYLELLAHNEAVVVPANLLLPIAQRLESDRLAQAVSAYRSIIQHHLTRPEAEYAMLRLVDVYYRVYQQPYEALRLVTEFLQRYPQSEWSADARRWYQALTTQLGVR
jgi:membrane associated rhomboid family serine protease